MDNKYLVYKHTSPSGKVYIGITSNKTQTRWRGGSGYITNHRFSAAIKKHGWRAFTHEVLAEGLTRSEARQKEVELIALYDSTNPEKGYNIDPGGGVRSEETRAKLSVANTGKHHSVETRAKLSEIRKGRKLTETCKRKISEGHKCNPLVQAHILKINKARVGVPQSEEHRRHLSESQPSRRAVVNLDTGEQFACMRDAATSVKGSHPNIVKACTGERLTAYGFRWAYAEEAST